MMKTTVDVIIVADSSREEFRTMTQSCIATVQKSNPAFDYNIIIVESWDGFAESGHRYEGCKVVIPGVPFNYNLFLQYGIAQGTAEWVALCNNDLLFDPEWMVEIDRVYSSDENFDIKNEPPFIRRPWCRSFSPWCPLVHPHRFPNENNVHLGFRIAYELTGWCIIVRRDLVEKMHLDTRVEFWFSDNIYADELMRLEEEHALVTAAVVTHLGSKTLNTRPRPEWKRLTTGQKIKYKSS